MASGSETSAHSLRLLLDLLSGDEKVLRRPEKRSCGLGGVRRERGGRGDHFVVNIDKKSRKKGMNNGRIAQSKH